MASETKTIQVIKSVYAEDLPEYYTVQVWQKSDTFLSGLPGKSWCNFGLQSKTPEGLRDVLAEAMEFHAKVRILKTTNEIIDIPKDVT